MDIVFLKSKTEIDKAKQLYPKNRLVLGRIVNNESDLLALKSLCSESGLPGVVVLDSLDSAWVSKVRQAGFKIGVWPKSASALNQAVSSKQTDFVFQVANSQKPFFDLAVFSVASQNHISFVFVLDAYLQSSVRLVELVKNTLAGFSLANKTRVPALVVSGAVSVQGLRAENDLAVVSDWFSSHCQGTN